MWTLTDYWISYSTIKPWPKKKIIVNCFDCNKIKHNFFLSNQLTRPAWLSLLHLGPNKGKIINTQRRGWPGLSDGGGGPLSGGALCQVLGEDEMGRVSLPRTAIFPMMWGEEHYSYSKTNTVTLGIKQNCMILWNKKLLSTEMPSFFLYKFVCFFNFAPFSCVTS